MQRPSSGPLPAAPRLPLLLAPQGARVLAWQDGQPIDTARFLADVRAVAATLPAAPAAVNLCEDRYAFMVAFCALVLRGQVNLLPPSRAPQAVDEVMAAHPGCYAIGEQPLQPAPAGYHRVRWPSDRVVDESGEPPLIDAEQLAVIAYTSGSTGVPQAHAKRWRHFHASNAGNLAMLRARLGEPPAIVATVPPQHIFGLETSVLLPLLGQASVHTGRPFFPGDVASALAPLPEPRLLVTTPVHLRALLEAEQALPALVGVLSATAPMPAELAQRAERQLGCPVLEVFGSTETCAIASRRSAGDEPWQLYAGVQLQPQPDGSLVSAPQLDAPVLLADIVGLLDDGRRFRLHGRQADLLEIAGKRASLSDLTRRLLAIEGVQDGVIFQLEASPAGVRRLAALVVAPELDEAAITAALRPAMDAVFLPRRLRKVAALPRNESGKLPREALLALLNARP